MDIENLSFLDEEKHSDKINTLHILKNGKEDNLEIEDIFETARFDNLIAVTYSVSPSFVNQYLTDFDMVEIVIGIDNNEIKKSMNELAKHLKDNILKQIRGESIKFYEELNTESKFKLDRGNLKLRVSTTHIIHSKFYLLWNDNGDNRIILGSANLSNRAFDRDSTQFEDIIIFDNSKLFNIYMDYYKDNISRVLSDYIPQELHRLNAKKFKGIEKIEDIDTDEVFIISNEDVEKIKEKAAAGIINDVSKNINLGLYKEDVIKQMDNISVDRSLIKNRQKEKDKFEEVAYELVHESINKRKKEPAIKSKQAIDKQTKKKIEKVLVKKLEDEDESLARGFLYSKIDLRDTKNLRSGLFVRSNLNNSNLIPF